MGAETRIFDPRGLPLDLIKSEACSRAPADGRAVPAGAPTPTVYQGLAQHDPDVDAIYMDAVTALAGRGGWPMTVFLDPEGRPFHAGTYWPKQERGGMPSFRQVLTAVHEAWTDRRDDLSEMGSRVLDRMAVHADLEPGEHLPPTGTLEQAVTNSGAGTLSVNTIMLLTEY